MSQITLNVKFEIELISPLGRYLNLNNLMVAKVIEKIGDIGTSTNYYKHIRTYLLQYFDFHLGMSGC